MEYLERIEKNREEMIKTLQDLLAIRSVAEAALPGMPFGKGIAEAYHFLMEKARLDGFLTEDVEGYGGHIEFGGVLYDEEGDPVGESHEILGVLGHLDVVPEGNHWDFPPYGGEISDGKIYGRGAIDDKGPVIAAYYAMKALKEAGYKPKRKVRLILGLDEETDWKGMEKYFQKAKPLTLGFTPDAEFPVIHAEMGILVFDLARKMGKQQDKGLILSSIKGGAAPNMVADSARAVLRDSRPGQYEKIKGAAAAYRSETGYKLNVKGVGKSLEVTTQGISAHGARPAHGLNAISILMDFLGRIPFADENVNEMITFYNEHIGFQLHGENLGCALSDEVSGELILNVGMVSMDGKAVRFTLNVRYPVTASEEEVYAGILPLLERFDFGVVKTKCQTPLFFPEDHPMVETLMEIYREHTGDAESKALVIGGGTYARSAENTVAFGALFPGQPEIAHQKNEYIGIEEMMRMTRIYADALQKLSELAV